MRPPISVIVSIAKAVEQAGGDLTDVEDLVAVWERVQIRAELRADAIRRGERSRSCCCANRPNPGRDGRCPVCNGWPATETSTNTKEKYA